MAMTLRADKGAILSWNEMDSNFKACMGLHNFLHVQDKKPSGTSGGNFTAGSWRTRTLNTVLVNTISGASLSVDQVTLPSGSYFCIGICPFYTGSFAAPGNVQARVYSVSGTTELCVSGPQYLTGSSGAFISGANIVSGSFSVGADAIIELQHRCSATKTDNGFGVHAGYTTEVFADLKIWKLS